MSALPRLRDRKGALALAYVSTAVPALLGALPFAALLGATWGDDPRGDSLLWKPGGAWLLESGRLFSRELAGVARLGPWISLAFATAAIVPWSAVVVVLSRAERVSLPTAIAVAFARFPTLFGLFGLTLLARALLALGSTALAGLVVTFSKNERTASLAALGALLVGAIAMGVLGVARDLAEAAALRHGSGGANATLTALGVLRERFASLCVAFGLRAGVGLTLVLAVAALVARLDVTRAGAAFVIALLHQTTVLAVVVVRASWLSVALEAVGDRNPSKLDEA